MKKIKNPLQKRILRELWGDWRKYLIVFLFLTLTIGFVSGMYVANESMITSEENGVTEYKLEDGHFEVQEQPSDELLADIADNESAPVTLYENFFRNEEEDQDGDGTADGTVRVFPQTEDVNLACVLEGVLPTGKHEIAIDRMHADNVGIKVGDTILVGGEDYEVCGLIAYVNYATLHEKSTDLMFDALKFDAAMVTEEGFDRLSAQVHYAYAWKYEDEPKDESEEKSLSDDFRTELVTQVMLSGNSLSDYSPRYANPAINFAPDDMGSDKAMGGVLLDILIVIIAFIFGVTISNTITKEASTIGTLRASGYTKGELVRHYLSMPVIVTLFAACVGNLLGYTVFKNVVVGMYYNSYSLPTYHTIWNADAFVKTTVVPIILMFVVNLIIITCMMKHTPLQFLRHDLKKTKRQKAMRLPKWRFFRRFRLRIMSQNAANYLILFIGIAFIMIMLAMAVGMPDTLSYYQKHAPEMMIAKYQYVLKSWQDETGATIETEEESAEKFSMKSLLRKSDVLDEEISVYGISADSQYVNIAKLQDLKEDGAYISGSFAEKYDVKEGDTITLSEKYEEKEYTWTVKGTYDGGQSIAVYLPLDQYREVFDQKEEAFSGFFSNTELTDLDENQIATVVTVREITKMCDQMDHSMGSYMTYFQYLCILLSAAMIYLLTKLIIEKNENAISMTKILGYTNKEIASLYLTSTTIIVIIEDLLSVGIGAAIMKKAWKMIMMEYSGWYAFRIEPMGYIKMFAFVLIGYLIVMIFDFKRIKKVPMDEALKNIE